MEDDLSALDKRIGKGERRMPDPDHWSFKKEIAAGHLLTTVSFIVLLISWGNGVDKRIIANQVINDRQDLATASELKSMNARMSIEIDNIDEKMSDMRQDIREIHKAVIGSRKK